jgi:hypothetical protein
MQPFVTDPVLSEALGLAFARLKILTREGALITVAEAASILKCSTSTVRVWVRRGRLCYVVDHMLLKHDVMAFKDRVPSRRGLHLRLPKPAPGARG